MSASPADSVNEMARVRIDEINSQIDDIAASVQDIADATTRHSVEGKLIVVKTKREMMRTMTSIARLKRIQAELEIVAAGTELGLELADLRRKRGVSEERGAKRVRLCDEMSAELNRPTESKHTSSSSTSRKKSQKDSDKSKSSASKEKAADQNTSPPRTSTPQKSQGTHKKEDSSKRAQSRSKPKTQHGEKSKSKPASKTEGQSVSKFPTVGKSIIFLDHPPVREVRKLANNVGYYTPGYARKLLGYVPRDLSIAFMGSDCRIR